MVHKIKRNTDGGFINRVLRPKEEVVSLDNDEFNQFPGH